MCFTEDNKGNKVCLYQKSISYGAGHGGSRRQVNSLCPIRKQVPGLAPNLPTWGHRPLTHSFVHFVTFCSKSPKRANTSYALWVTSSSFDVGRTRRTSSSCSFCSFSTLSNSSLWRSPTRMVLTVRRIIRQSRKKLMCLM